MIYQEIAIKYRKIKYKKRINLFQAYPFPSFSYDSFTAYLLLNLSSINAITAPAARQTRLRIQPDTLTAKLPNGIIITVAAITMPIIA